MRLCYIYQACDVCARFAKLKCLLIHCISLLLCVQFSLMHRTLHSTISKSLSTILDALDLGLFSFCAKQITADNLGKQSN